MSVLHPACLQPWKRLAVMVHILLASYIIIFAEVFFMVRHMVIISIFYSLLSYVARALLPYKISLHVENVF